ncbi:DUF6255 family natural product biosynthesis protein [Streptomyces cinnamoneus]|uniref:DUF6255 family natural product biosynthesis protein n=1 Tax=Streptomyces cinnamoneus TaxID=53446 RepID=UPI0033CCF53A
MRSSTAYAAGRLMTHCPHLAGWATTTEGESRCRHCGTRRFADYAAVRPPGLPQAVTPSDEARTVADRAAALHVGLMMTGRTAEGPQALRRVASRGGPAGPRGWG